MTLLKPQEETQVVSGVFNDIEVRVAEMGPLEDTGTDIPVDQDKMRLIKETDETPQFVVLELEAGVSKNKREWPAEIMQSIVEQVNRDKPVGYKGHIPDDEDGTAFPDIQTIWLGAALKRVGSRVIARIKGYNMTDEIKKYARLGAVNSVSPRGDATMTRRKEGGWKVVNFKLESIDWARKNRAGMPGRIVAITSEMEGGNTVDGKDIAAIDESELRQHAPLLVQEIERKATEPLTAKVKEMEDSAAADLPKITALDEICKKLGVEGADAVAKVENLLSTVEGAASEALKGLVDKAIAKVAGKSERAQKLVKRFVGEQVVSEFQDSDLEGEKLSEAIEKKVSEMVEADEDVKAVVAEMDDSKPAGGGAALGGRSSRKEEESDRKSRTGKLTFEKQTL